MEPGQRILLYTSIVRLSNQGEAKPLPAKRDRPPPPAQTSIRPWMKIRMERVERNLTARDVADRAGISLDELRRIEAGRLRDAPLVHRVDRVLGTSFFNEYLTMN